MAGTSRQQDAEHFDNSWDHRRCRSRGLHDFGRSRRASGSFTENPDVGRKPAADNARHAVVWRGAFRRPVPSTRLTEEDALAIRRDIAAAQVAAPVLSRRAQVVAGNKNWSSLVAGIKTDYLIAREWRIVSGRTFTADELDNDVKVAIIGNVVADELFNGATAIGRTLRIGNVPFTVIGVLDKKGQGAMGRNQDDVVFIPLSTAKSRVLGAVRGNTRDALDFIVVKVGDASALSRRVTTSRRFCDSVIYCGRMRQTISISKTRPKSWVRVRPRCARSGCC